ncbi:hypothetical protein [Croceicoccus sp. BE223]|uniref:hypothetical protein n=1 Tax=Croceicoccus sp. BE223 TaxID=2817716 RepID=UPI00285502D1|nr:hypothetical protein [Croceicoccus sp. BE223]MDR7102437.1 multisubunit Na+/H+ antiporter MnhB subunit [Croceicoccus sp. BE223]
MTPEEQKQFQTRQKSRNKALGLVLVGLVVLFFALTIVRFPDADDRAAAAAEQAK